MKFPYRADHVGSLLRPQEILDARSNPDITSEQLRAIEDRHILRVLQRQKDLGLKIFTDGELRRRGFMSDFYESVDGLDKGDEVARSWKGASAATRGAAERFTISCFRLLPKLNVRRFPRTFAPSTRGHGMRSPPVAPWRAPELGSGWPCAGGCSSRRPRRSPTP